MQLYVDARATPQAHTHATQAQANPHGSPWPHLSKHIMHACVQGLAACMDGTWTIWKIALDTGLSICTRHMPAWHACILLWVNESFLFPGLPSRFLCRFFIHALLSGCNPCTLVGNTLSLQQFVLLRCRFLGSLCRLCLRFWCIFFSARCCFCDLCFFSFLSLLPTFALPIFRLLGFSLSRSLRLRLGGCFCFSCPLGWWQRSTWQSIFIFLGWIPTIFCTIVITFIFILCSLTPSFFRGVEGMALRAKAWCLQEPGANMGPNWKERGRE